HQAPQPHTHASWVPRAADGRGRLGTVGCRPARYRRSGTGELAAEGRAAGLQSGHRYAERRTGHVVEPDLVEEVHRVGVTTVLTADPELQVGGGGPASLDRDLDQPADP